MMEWKKSFWALSIALILLSAVQLSVGLRCYTCQYMNGRGDRECLNSPPPSRYLTECNQPQCWKKYSHYNGQHNVQRFCAAVNSEKSYCQTSSYEDMITGEIYPATECLCKTEGCNGSSITYSNFAASLLIAVIVVLFS